jgi:electron transport complex protein RnfB
MDLAAQIEDLLPQTQCTRCGYDDCRAYAEAVAAGAAHNQCPPGGAATLAALAALLHRPLLPPDPARGDEPPPRVALIDEAACIGCALCLKACPVDAILGAAKRMHSVLTEDCSGCDLCLPVCPVDCIAMQPAAAPAPGQAARWRALHTARRERQARQAHEQAAQRAALAMRLESASAAGTGT